MTDVKAPLAQLVADNQGAARTLDQLGLDYCCHGERILVDGRRDFRFGPLANPVRMMVLERWGRSSMSSESTGPSTSPS